MNEMFIIYIRKIRIKNKLFDRQVNYNENDSLILFLTTEYNIFMRVVIIFLI